MVRRKGPACGRALEARRQESRAQGGPSRQRLPADEGGGVRGGPSGEGGGCSGGGGGGGEGRRADGEAAEAEDDGCPVDAPAAVPWVRRAAAANGPVAKRVLAFRLPISSWAGRKGRRHLFVRDPMNIAVHLLTSERVCKGRGSV